MLHDIFKSWVLAAKRESIKMLPEKPNKEDTSKTVETR